MGMRLSVVRPTQPGVVAFGRPTQACSGADPCMGCQWLSDAGCRVMLCGDVWRCGGLGVRCESSNSKVAACRRVYTPENAPRTVGKLRLPVTLLRCRHASVRPGSTQPAVVAFDKPTRACCGAAECMGWLTDAGCGVMACGCVGVGGMRCGV
jgi:hypothetical protein